MCFNHPQTISQPTPVSMEKLFSMKPIPGAKRVGDCQIYPVPLTGKRHPFFAAAAAKFRQSCTTLCNPIDGSPPGSPVPGILQARTLEWVAISFSNV